MAASGLDRFTTSERTHYNHWIGGCLCLWHCLGTLKKKIALRGNQTTISVRSSSQPSHYTDYVILVAQSVQYLGCGLYDPGFDVWQGQQILALFETFRPTSVPNQHHSSRGTLDLPNVQGGRARIWTLNPVLRLIMNRAAHTHTHTHTHSRICCIHAPC